MEQMDITFQYKEPKSRLIQRIIFILFSIPASISVLYLSIEKIFIYVNSNDMKEIFSWSFIFLLIFFYLIITLFIIIELKRNNVNVELCEDKIIGSPRYSKRIYEMKFVDIKKISTGKLTAPLGVILTDTNNKRMILSVFIEPFRECLEKIISKAVNVKTIKIDDIKKNTWIWK